MMVNTQQRGERRRTALLIVGEKVRECIVTRAARDLPETRRCDDATIDSDAAVMTINEESESSRVVDSY
jgi:hypothetical protein